MRAWGCKAPATRSTDNSSLVNLDETAYKAALTSLANRLQYNGAAGSDGKVQNFTGIAAINESMTAPWAKSEILFKNGSQASNTLNESTFSNGTGSGTITYGDYETAIMSGVKSVMTSSAMAWRAENNDLLKRMGDLRLAPGDDGVWARVYAGKSEYDKDKAQYDTSYKTIQVGYDKAVGNNGWRLGTAISYTDGQSEYEYGGDSDDKSTSLAFYGTWKGDKGHYLDLILKGSKLNSDYKVFNAEGQRVKGEYDTWGTSISAEYGRHIKQNNGFYYEPQLEFTYGHLKGDDYTVSSDFKDSAGNYKSMQVRQNGMNSLIGRLGIGIGRETEKSSIYAKASLAHEFCGDVSTYYAADNMPKNTKQDFGDTWMIFQLGGTTALNNHTYAYGNFEKTAGGDMKTDWRVDAGLRWTF